jgi:regulator of sigma E protease
MNLLLAYIILLGLCLAGLPPIIQHQFSIGRPTYAQAKSVMAVDVVPGSPAAQAGVKRGDLVLSGDGQGFQDEQSLLEFTKSHAGRKVSLQLSHQGHERTAEVQLLGPQSHDGYLGVTPFQTYKLRYAVWQAPVVAAGILFQLVWATLAAFGGLIFGLFIHGQVSSQVTGPVGIVVILKNIIDLGLSYVLVFVLSISISLAVINAMPLPALDGGRWAIVLANKLTGKPISARTEGIVHAVGFALLLVLMAVITFFDIKRLGS